MKLVRFPLRQPPRNLAAAIFVISLSACGKGADQGNAEAVVVSQAAKDEANLKWATCATCHGENGEGNGPAGAALTPKPRNFTLAEWQSSVDDASLRRIILGGGMSVGKSPLMPPNPDLESKPEVIAALVQKIRGLKK